MKLLLSLSFMFMVLTTNVRAQQNINARLMQETPLTSMHLTGSKSGEATDEKTLTSRFGIYGYGSLNSDALEEINTSAKFSCYIVPAVVPDKFRWLVNLSFNKNASNSDSLLAGTVLFPEVGNTSFILSTDFILQASDDISFAPFGEVSYKTIKQTENDSMLHFDVLNYTMGLKFLYTYQFSLNNVPSTAVFSMAGYAHCYNIPDEDNGDYRYLLNDPGLQSHVWSLGLKTQVQFTDFSIFADMRHTYVNDGATTNRELQGFNANIGVTISAPLLRL